MKVRVVRAGSRITVLTTHPRDIVNLGVTLRSLTNVDEIISVKGGFMVPSEMVFALSQLFPFESNDWDNELYEQNLRTINKIQCQAIAKAEVNEALEDPYSTITDYEAIGQLDPHQVEAVAAMIAPSLHGMALFDEQGTGKTISVLAAFDILKRRGSITHLLVVCPKSVLSVWKEEVESFLGDRYSISILVNEDASPMQILSSNDDIILINYEAVIKSVSMLKGMASTKNRKFMLAVDESYYVKNPIAKRSRAIAQLRKFCTRAYVICGTPAPNSPVDVLHQLDITNAGTSFGELSIPSDQDSAAAVVQKALGNSAIYLRRLKEEVLPELYPKMIKKTFVELQPVQSKLYKDALHKLVIDVRRVDNTYFRKHLGEFIARKWTLLQICSNPGGIDPLYAEIPAKLLALDEIVRNIVEEQRLKVVIWSFFRYSLQAIMGRYADCGIVRIDGSVDSIEERSLAIQKFQKDPSIRIFLGNPAAAGAGITLTAAHHAVYESFSNQPAHYLQSVDRLHRRGQKKPVTSFVLISRDTIEERDFSKITNKERRGHEIFGKKPTEPVTREGFLKDLIGY